MPNSLPDRVARRLEALPGGAAVCVGLSGGVDSVALLHLLHALAPRLGWRLSALHVHHGISPNADAWADFCSGLCAGYAIPLQIEHVDIAPLRQHGIEAAARQVRLAAYRRQSCDYIALAHHADDQAETLLLQLLRGAGVKGVAAMPPVKPASGVAPAMLRPLLDVSRSELMAYAAQHGLAWIEDESNADDSYPRNFLRHCVLPVLAQRFPAYRATLARSAQHFAEAGALLDELAAQDAGREGGGSLSVSRLSALSHARAKNLLRHHLQCQGAPLPQAAQLDDMLHQLCTARGDAAVCVTYGGWQVRRYRDGVHVSPVPGAFDPARVQPWRGETELPWPALARRIVFTRVQGAGVNLEKLQGSVVTLRLRNGGEALRQHPASPRRSLKNLLQERAVPPWQRERLPLLYCGDELVCIVGVAVDADWLAQPGEAGVEAALA